MVEQAERVEPQFCDKYRSSLVHELWRFKCLEFSFNLFFLERVFVFQVHSATYNRCMSQNRIDLCKALKVQVHALMNNQDTSLLKHLWFLQ